MLAHKVHLISPSNPLKYLMKNPIPSSRLTRLILALSEFDIQVRSPIGKKSQALAELLATFPIVGEDVTNEEFPGDSQEVIMVEEDEEWKLLFDGDVPPGGGGIGIVLIRPQLQEVTETYKLTYICSNNEAKYEALIMGLELARSKGIQWLTIKGDS